MERDITKIVKRDLLAKHVQLAIDELQPKIDKWAEEAKKDLDRALRNSDKMFKLNAERSLLQHIIRYCTGMEQVGEGEMTFQDLHNELGAANRFVCAVPRSTSATGNLAEQYILDEAVTTCHGNGGIAHIFLDAQRDDPEWQAVAAAEAAVAEEKREAAQALAEQKRRDERAARRAAKKGNV